MRRIEPDTVDGLRAAIHDLESYIAMLMTAGTRDELLGVEGIAARSYFAALRGLLPIDIGFEGRVRRPPGDVVNAALSYGYAILVGECTTALVAAGLDPAVGLLHEDRGSRPSLALDLAEEFRPLVVDTVVLLLVRSRKLTVAHGRPVEQDRGVLLTEAGRTVLIEELERRLLTRVYHPGHGHKTSYRRCIHLQAQAIAAVVAGRTESYDPMLWRV